MSSLSYYQIGQAFQAEYNGQPNVMTPTIVRRGSKGRLAYEISSGTGIDHQPIFGFTVIQVGTFGRTERRRDLSKLCQSQGEVERAVKDLKDATQ